MKDESRTITSVSIAAISRHRIVLDGRGVRTLVVLQGCPLRCAYCLNRFAIDPTAERRHYTAEELIREVMTDNLYFLATSGGITFGGGEPLLQSRFISEFRKKCPAAWSIDVETSLNVPIAHLAQAAQDIQHFSVDIKDMNPSVYQRYTMYDNTQTIANLQWLLAQGRANDITVRVPLIPHYNTEKDVAQSIEKLKEMGVRHFDRLTYVIRDEKQ